MDREQYENAKRRLEEVTRRLRNEQMSAVERDRLEREGAQLAKAVMSPWIPFGWGYRIVMILIAAIGFWGLMEERYSFVLIWLVLLIFSPRIVGEIVSVLTGFKKDDRR